MATTSTTHDYAAALADFKAAWDEWLRDSEPTEELKRNGEACIHALELAIAATPSPVSSELVEALITQLEAMSDDTLAIVRELPAAKILVAHLNKPAPALSEEEQKELFREGWNAAGLASLAVVNNTPGDTPKTFSEAWTARAALRALRAAEKGGV